MEGKRDEVLAKKEERKKAWEASKGKKTTFSPPSNSANVITTTVALPIAQSTTRPVKNSARQIVYYQLVKDESVSTAYTITPNHELETLYTAHARRNSTSSTCTNYSMILNTCRV